MEPLSNTPSDPQPDWAQLLPREAFYEIVRVLRGALPPPDGEEPEAGERRDRAAMAGVAALLPVNAAEARLAAQFVVADAWAMDCLRLARERRLELEIARKCRAQALSLMREAKGALRLLQKVQAGRQAIEKDAEAADRAAWVEHGAVSMMQEALASLPAKREPEVRAQKSFPPEFDLGDEIDEVLNYGSGSIHAALSHSTRAETEPRARSAA